MHLGVTEAGEGEDGRMKSAIGIGSLLADGLGTVKQYSVALLVAAVLLPLHLLFDLVDMILWDCSLQCCRSEYEQE